MGFQSLKDAATHGSASNVRAALAHKTNRIASQLDPFFLSDLAEAINQKYKLEIMSNHNGRYTTVKVRDALIDLDDFERNMLLPLKLEVELKGNVETLDYNISEIEANTNISSFENPKYYIYCDHSKQVSFRFWFIKQNSL